MAGKTKQNYLDISFAQGENRTKKILKDAIDNKGIDAKFVFIRHKDDGTKEVCLRKDGVDKLGVGSSKAEATADAAGKF